MMRKGTNTVAMMICLMLSGCAFMMNLDAAYASKHVQKDIKEIGALVDTLKFQKTERYSYRILAANAEKITELSERMNRAAPDSYYIRMTAALGRHARELQAAAGRGNAAATGGAIKEILGVWEILEQYRKPA